MMTVGKKYSRKRRTYPIRPEIGLDDHDKAALIVGTNKTSHGSLECAKTEVDVELAPQFKDFVMEECQDSTGLVLVSVTCNLRLPQQEMLTMVQSYRRPCALDRTNAERHLCKYAGVDS